MTPKIQKADFFQTYFKSWSIDKTLASLTEEGFDLIDFDTIYEWVREIERADEKKPPSPLDILWEMYDWLQNLIDSPVYDDPNIKLHLNEILHTFALHFLYEPIEEED